MSKLKKILIKTRRQVFSEIIGNNPSIFEGEGFDFSQLREYSYGDDIRKIDWNTTAKMQKPFVKVFHEQRELNIVVISLLGGSVFFGQKKLKQELIAEIAAIIAYTSIKNADKFSSFIYNDSLQTITPPSKKIYSVQKAIAKILDYPVLGKKIDAKNLAKKVFENIKRRSIIFIIGDFFQKYDLRLLTKKHELITIVVRDKLEESPKELGTINLYDPQSLKNAFLQIDKNTAKKYTRIVRQNDIELFKNFRKTGISYTKIYTNDEPFVKLSKLFMSR